MKHVWGRKGMHRGFSCESHKEDLDVGGRIILRWTLEIKNRAIWTGLIWLRIGTNEGLL
jgi:hypothetical protein